jgi:F-type H+-transporting ATPase subunit gamma
MPSAREMRVHIRSVGNIAQVTRALQAVSANKVRKAQKAVEATRPYSSKAWQVLQHLSSQPGRQFVHPLLSQPARVRQIMVVLITSDRGLAGPYNVNVVRHALERFRYQPIPVSYVVVGRKGRDMLARRRMDIRAEFSNLPPEPVFADVSAIGRLVVEEFLDHRADEVYLVYTDFVNMLRQVPRALKLLPLEMAVEPEHVERRGLETREAMASYIYEPGEAELVAQIVPRFTALQIFQAILESLASEHGARMLAMQDATQNAQELTGALRLEYNKMRQQSITSDMLDIAGGAEALAKAEQA